MDSEPGSKQGRKRVNSGACSSSDGAQPPLVKMRGLTSSDSEPTAFVKMRGLTSSDSEPTAFVKMRGLTSSDSEPTAFVKMRGLTSSDSEPTAFVKMRGLSDSSDSAPLAFVEMQGHYYSDNDDSSGYESSYYDSEADNEFEENSELSMIVDEPGAELEGPELSEAESDASTRIERIWSNMVMLSGELKMGELQDDVLYGTELDGEQIKSKILELFSEVEASILKDGVHYFKTPWNKTVFHSTLGYYVIKKPSKSGYATMLSRKASLCKCLLSRILDLIRDGTKETPEGVKYWDETLYVQVQDVKPALDDICLRFRCVRSSLKIMSGSKGLVVGQLRYRAKDRMIDCNACQVIPTEEAIPEDLESEAYWILIVEKETVFQRLATPDFFQRYRCIMVTGKGLPSVSARMFVQSLRRNLKLPVFVLVDCNPTGFLIMSAYRHGSETRGLENHRMAVPDVKWLGLHPTEVATYNLSKHGVPLTKDDINSCKSFLKKKCVNDVPEFKQQLEHMLRTKTKYQIEALGTSRQTLIKYLRDKLEMGTWI